ncbi:MAG TPA: VWA domain-containing protein [bacterium]|nr:VWA domain-containing protein [bacterium]
MILGVPAALWGLATLPFLILLYLLRVRRRDHPVSSVLLWQRSAPTLAAYRPSRRIERSVLLLLQLLAAAALVIGLARPALVAHVPAQGDLILVLDLSLSMRARDVSPTRFERARAEALDAVAHLRGGGRVALIDAGPRPQLLVPLTDDRERVAAALRALEPWDAAGDVAAAVVLAAEQPVGPGGRILVWTDAARGSLPALPEAAYRILGTSDDNVGITAFRAMRAPAGAEGLVRIDNFSARARRVPLEVTHDRSSVYRSDLDVPAGGARTAVFPITGSGVFSARITTHDMLPDDDVASTVLDPAPLPSVLLVSRGNPYLERLLGLLPVGRAAETASAAPAAWGGYGVVILDRVDAGPVPPGDYLLIDTVPPNLPATSTGEVRTPLFAAWDETDPILRFVNLTGVRVAKALALTPQGGRVLAGGDVPLLWAYEGGGIRAVLLGFALQDSDLPQHVAFPILVANALAWLGGGALDLAAGETLQVPAAGGSAAELTGPDGSRRTVRATEGMYLLPPFVRAGAYLLTTPAGVRAIAVRNPDPRAGMIRPGLVPVLPGAAAPHPERAALLTQVAVWPWVVSAALAALIGEWVLATRRRGGDA